MDDRHSAFLLAKKADFIRRRINQSANGFGQHLDHELPDRGQLRTAKAAPALTSKPAAETSRGPTIEADVRKEVHIYKRRYHAQIGGAALGDRIDQSPVFNEPRTIAHLGYRQNIHSPERTEPPTMLRATHTVNLALGMSFRALKAASPHGLVGNIYDIVPMLFKTSSAADAVAAARCGRFLNRWFLEPALTGAYSKVYPSRQSQSCRNQLLHQLDGRRQIRRHQRHLRAEHDCRLRRRRSPHNRHWLGHSEWLLRYSDRYAPAHRQSPDRDHLERRELQCQSRTRPPQPRNPTRRSGVWGVSDVEAGNHVFYYWGGALVGRFIGAGVLRVVKPGKALAAVATGAIVLILVSANTGGAVSGWSLLAIGLMNAIMFPTIFGLASEGLGPRRAEGSGVIATAIVGGAVVPLLTGWLADQSSLQAALALPAACCLAIAAFGIYSRQPARNLAPASAGGIAGDVK